MKYAFLRYIGAKHRISKQISSFLHATGKTCLCEVFGGSAAVMLNAGFQKRVYNDLDGDLVNLFRVLADVNTRYQLLEKLQYYPPSRQIFEEERDLYVNSGLTFATITDKIERGRATFYRHSFAFGGKTRSGGFQVSITGRSKIKELAKYIDNLARFDYFADFFFNTVIEHLPFDKFFSLYSQSADAVLYVDPPYAEIQHVYAIPFSPFEHIILSQLCLASKAPVVVSAYDNKTIRELYSTANWIYHPIDVVKNSSNFKGKYSKKQMAPEVILSRKE